MLLKSPIKRPTSTEEQVTLFVKVLVKETETERIFFFVSGFQMNKEEWQEQSYEHIIHCSLYLHAKSAWPSLKLFLLIYLKSLHGYLPGPHST